MNAPDTEFVSVLGTTGKPDAPPPISTRVLPETLPILGLSDIVIFPGMVGNDAFVKKLSHPHEPAWNNDTGAVAEADILHLLNARRVRRMISSVKK